MGAGYAPAHKNLGMALVKLGQTNEAVAHLQEAFRLDPKPFAGKATIGVAGSGGAGMIFG